MQESSKKSQGERLAEKLLELKPDITEKDRVAAIEHFKITPETISKYLNGKVQNNDTAFSFIEFFKERIAERDKALS